jgi:hypothetical protein
MFQRRNQNWGRLSNSSEETEFIGMLDFHFKNKLKSSIFGQNAEFFHSYKKYQFICFIEWRKNHLKMFQRINQDWGTLLNASEETEFIGMLHFHFKIKLK